MRLYNYYDKKWYDFPNNIINRMTQYELCEYLPHDAAREAFRRYVQAGNSIDSAFFMAKRIYVDDIVKE